MNEIDNRFLRGVYIKNNSIRPIFRNRIMTRSQDLPKVYLDSAHFTFEKIHLEKKVSIFVKDLNSGDTKNRSIDVDTISDLNDLKKRFKRK